MFVVFCGRKMCMYVNKIDTDTNYIYVMCVHVDYMLCFIIHR